MNQCSIKNILLTPKLKLLLAGLFRCKFQSHRKVFLNMPVITALLAMHSSASYTTLRNITMFRGASYTFLSETKQTQSTFRTVYKYIILTFKKSSDVGTA